MPANIAALVRDAARTRPDHPALLAGPERLTWGDLDARADAVAAALQAGGTGRRGRAFPPLSPGDRVAIRLGNTADFAAVYFGSLRAGLVAVPLNPSQTGTELRQLLADCRAGVLVTAEPDSAAGAGDLPGQLPVASPADLLAAGAGAPTPTGAGGHEDLAAVLYTSGSRGTPRGAMLTHRALLANLGQLSRLDLPALGPTDVMLLAVPMFHVYGLNAGLGLLAYHGATGVLVEHFDASATLELIGSHRVTTVIGTPSMYVAWSMLPVTAGDLRQTFGSVRLASSGSALLPATASAALAERAGLAVFEGYGLTETAPVLTSTLVSGTPKPHSIGRPIPGVELRLIDSDGDPVEDDDAGEIVVRGANLFSGYWPDGAGGPDADGWFATGDVAYADDDGDLHLVGRRKELIVVSGFHVYPREVEAVLLAHPGITAAAVVAVGAPMTGEAVKAVVVRAESPDGGDLDAESVIAHCLTSLARFKCPSVVEFVGELPLTATGKVRRDRLARR